MESFCLDNQTLLVLKFIAKNSIINVLQGLQYASDVCTLNPTVKLLLLSNISKYFMLDIHYITYTYTFYIEIFIIYLAIQWHIYICTYLFIYLPIYIFLVIFFIIICSKFGQGIEVNILNSLKHFHVFEVFSCFFRTFFYSSIFRFVNKFSLKFCKD